jgi:hypothetical protein
VRIARIFNTYGPRMHENDGRMTKTVHAVRRGESLDLLEPLDVPEGTELAVTIEIPPTSAQLLRPACRCEASGPSRGYSGARTSMAPQAELVLLDTTAPCVDRPGVWAYL